MARLTRYIAGIALVLITSTYNVRAEDEWPYGFRYPPMPTEYVGHPMNTSIKAVWDEKGKKIHTTSDRASSCAAVSDGLTPFRIMAYDGDGEDKPFWIEGMVVESLPFTGNGLDNTGFRLVRNYRQPKSQFPLTFYQREGRLVYCYEHVTHTATVGTDKDNDARVELQPQNDIPEGGTEVRMEERADGEVVLSTNDTTPTRTVACWSEIWKHKAYDQLSLVTDEWPMPKNCHRIRAMRKEFI
jgi:hypothetical protein